MIDDIDIKKCRVVSVFKSGDLPDWTCINFVPEPLVYVRDGEVRFKVGIGQICEEDLKPVQDPEDQFYILQKLAAMDQKW